MATFAEANKVRTTLKMKMSQHHWYNSSRITSCNDGYMIVLLVTDTSDLVKKVIPPLVDGVEIKIELA